MSKVKNLLIDIHGEDWTSRLADIAAGRKVDNIWQKKN